MIKTSVFLLCITALSVAEGFFVPINSPRHVAGFAVSPLAMSTNSNSNTNLFESLLGGFFGQKAEVVDNTPPPPPPLPDVVIEPDFRLAGIFLVGGLILDTIPYIQLVLGPLITILGILFLIQTFRIRFVFDQDAFELKQGDSLADTGENIVVGGANRWTYDSFVNVSVCVFFWALPTKEATTKPLVYIFLTVCVCSMISFQKDGLINHRDQSWYTLRKLRRLLINGTRVLDNRPTLRKRLPRGRYQDRFTFFQPCAIPNSFVMNLKSGVAPSCKQVASIMFTLSTLLVELILLLQYHYPLKE